MFLIVLQKKVQYWEILPVNFRCVLSVKLLPNNSYLIKLIKKTGIKESLDEDCSQEETVKNGFGNMALKVTSHHPPISDLGNKEQIYPIKCRNQKFHGCYNTLISYGLFMSFIIATYLIYAYNISNPHKSKLPLFKQNKK